MRYFSTGQKYGTMIADSHHAYLDANAKRGAWILGFGWGSIYRLYNTSAKFPVLLCNIFTGKTIAIFTVENSLK
jgi:hypothetical protein